MSAWACGILGSAVCFWLGMGYLGLSWGESLHVILASNLAGFVALHSVMKVQRTPSLKRWVHGFVRTWCLLSSLYIAVVVLACPPMRDFKVFAWLLFPGVFSTGFNILAYGPVQDRIVARQQRQARKPLSVDQLVL